jgi:ATP-dependent DNA helicase DinG
MASVPLPAWVEDIRPHQATAVDEVCEAFDAGNDVVGLDAPTGSGKTLIAELVRRRLDLPTLYVCTDKSLMDQFGRDFPYAKLLKGRANYPVLDRTKQLDLTAEDCTSTGPGDECWYCHPMHLCPYQVAKKEALYSPLAVTNTAFLLAEANTVGNFSGRPLVVADECDTLEKMLMGYVEYEVSATRIKAMGMEEPGKGIHKPTMVKWLEEFATQTYKAMVDEQDAKKLRSLGRLYEDTKRIQAELQREVDKKQSDDSEGRWIRLYDERYGGLHYKPVMVDSYGTRRLWRHGRKWLLMSATIISMDELADSLGLPLQYTTVKVPMTFPVENRPVIMAPVANVVYKEMQQAIPRLVKAITVAINKHPHDRILIHTVSYNLAKSIQEGLRHADIGPRRIITYSDGANRERVLAEYKRTPGCVMLAPSMARGIDLPGDLCRVQIIAKTPFLSLGDTQVSRRSHMPGGDVWYSVQAIRDIVQMTGRAVRSKDDHAITYIFDQQFATNLWRKNKMLFPDWWRESVITNINIREFMT